MPKEQVYELWKCEKTKILKQITLYNVVVVIFCYFKKKFKAFCENNSFFFEISASLFWTSPSSKPYTLNLLRIGFFGAAHRWGCGRGQKDLHPPFIKSVTDPTIMELGTVILYLKKIQKNINHATQPLSSVDISIFLSEIQQLLLYQEIQI